MVHLQESVRIIVSLNWILLHTGQSNLKISMQGGRYMLGHLFGLLMSFITYHRVAQLCILRHIMIIFRWYWKLLLVYHNHFLDVVIVDVIVVVIMPNVNFWYAKETHKRLWWYISVNCMIIHCFCTHNVTVYIFTNQRLVLFFKFSFNFAAMLPKMNRLNNTYVLPIWIQFGLIWMKIEGELEKITPPYFCQEYQIDQVT